MASGQSHNRTVRISHYSNEFARIQSDRHVGNAILRNMYEDDKLCDVSLYGVPPAGAELSSLRPIRSYKAVLAHASRHLYDLFTVDGYTDSRKAEYNILIIDHETLRCIVEFIHTDTLMLEVKNAVEVVRKILIGAKYLLMKDLTEGCEDHLAERTDLGNCISLWCFARKYSCLTLMEATSTFIAIQHLRTLTTDDVFLRMTYADLAKLLMSEAVITASSGPRYYAAIAWLEFANNTDSRSQHVYDVMNMIPLASGLLSHEIIFHADENEMLREHVPDLLRQAAINALKQQTKQVAVPQLAAIQNKTVNKFEHDLTDELVDALPMPAHPLTIEVWFTDRSRGSLSVKCTSETTIKELKNRIKQLGGVQCSYLGRGRCTNDLNNDHWTLGCYGITDKAWIYASR